MILQRLNSNRKFFSNGVILNPSEVHETEVSLLELILYIINRHFLQTLMKHKKSNFVK